MDNFEQMIEYMVQDLVRILCESQHIEYDKAMGIVYGSEVYDKLQNKATELYKDSPYYVFGLLQDELNFGHIMQAEI